MVRCFAGLERYTSPSQLAAEQRVLFRGLSPLILGRASLLPEPGSFFTHDATGVPFLVTRDAWGAPHAFLNQCRHRGARLVYDERGKLDETEPRFVCRIHGWSYDACGRMTNVALSKCDAEQMRHESSLLSMKCATRHGFVWLGRGPFRDDWDLATDLGEIDARLAALGLEAAEVRDERTDDVTDNWKHVVEGLLTGRGLFVFPSSFVRVGDDGGLEHLAVFPQAVDVTRIVTTGLTGAGETVGGLPQAPTESELAERVAALHERIERTIAAHPRPALRR